jgi:LacI family transcriptional regulator
LLSLGHRRIGFLGGRPDLESARLREQGYRAALKDAGVGVDPALMRVGGYRPDLADQPAHELLSMPDRPTAIFAANDLSAIRTMEVARELGLRIPEDVSVIGFDNVPESALTDPPLTTVAQPIHQMGAEALGMLTDLIRGVPREPHVRLPTSLVLRGSCRAPTGATS